MSLVDYAIAVRRRPEWRRVRLQPGLWLAWAVMITALLMALACGEVIVYAWMDCHRENSEKPYGTRLKAGQAVFARLVGK